MDKDKVVKTFKNLSYMYRTYRHGVMDYEVQSAMVLDGISKGVEAEGIEVLENAELLEDYLP